MVYESFLEENVTSLRLQYIQYTYILCVQKHFKSIPTVLSKGLIMRLYKRNYQETRISPQFCFPCVVRPTTGKYAHGIQALVCFRALMEMKEGKGRPDPLQGSWVGWQRELLSPGAL